MRHVVRSGKAEGSSNGEERQSENGQGVVEPEPEPEPEPIDQAPEQGPGEVAAADNAEPQNEEEISANYWEQIGNAVSTLPVEMFSDMFGVVENGKQPVDRNDVVVNEDDDLLIIGGLLLAAENQFFDFDVGGEDVAADNGAIDNGGLSEEINGQSGAEEQQEEASETTSNSNDNSSTDETDEGELSPRRLAELDFRPVCRNRYCFRPRRNPIYWPY